MAETTVTTDLVAQLDPKRNYGRIGYEGVIEGIREGKYLIQEGETLPVLRHAETGEMLKGTGVYPSVRTVTAARNEMREMFHLQATHRWPRVINALFKKAEDGDVKALKLVIETVLGRADVPRDTGERSLMQQLIAGGLQQYVATTQAAPVETEVTVVDAEVREA